MDGLWSADEQRLVESKMAVALVGGPETVKRKATEFVRATGVNEVIFTSDIYDHAARLRSFEIGAEVMKEVECLSLQPRG